jgi:dihydropteroate synthase
MIGSDHGDHAVIHGTLGSVPVGDDRAVVVMGAINVSPESFYAGSVAGSDEALLRTGEAMASAGASLFDVGALSTAPYLATAVSPEEEAERLGTAISLLTKTLDVPVSADTSRVLPARVALEAGARVINDVTGLTGDPGLGPLVAATGAGLVVMAGEHGSPSPGSPLPVVLSMLEESLSLAREAGVEMDGVVVDPGIGFFRRAAIPWHEWDCQVLAGLLALRRLGRPVLVGVSRKSFIGAIAGEADPARRLPGSLAATAAAVLGGAHVIRTHDVAETLQAVRVAEAVRRAQEDRP